MAAGNAYTPIVSTTLTSSQTELTFSSIPTTYTDLVVVMNYGCANADDYPCFQVGNGTVDSGANYSATGMKGDGTSATSGSGSNQTNFGTNSLYGTDPGTYYTVLNIPNYSNTSKYKTILYQAGRTSNHVESGAALWRSNSAINTLRIFLYYATGGRAFPAGSTFTIYGITAA